MKPEPRLALDADSCYVALRARDARFDGRFFVGVSSTGIYCRPVCAVRPPRRENCSFFPSAAAAELRGYRPCLRCRPELAPGFATIDASAVLARRAAGMIEDTLLAEEDVDAIGARLGVTGRHLRRVFGAEFGVSPVQYAQTQRLLLAKRLLTDTAMPMIDVAMASGFSSVRRFNALLRERYRLSPSQLRGRSGPADTDAPLSFDLAYRPPYDWTWMLGFLGARTVGGVESVTAGAYRRTVRVNTDGLERVGWLEVRSVRERPTLRVRLDPALGRCVAPVIARVKRLFDTDCRPDEVCAALGPLAADAPGLRLPGAFDGFELAVRAILGQQVSVKAAHTLGARIAERFGTPVVTPHRELTLLFPHAETLAAASSADVAACGIVRSRAEAIVALARALHERRISLEPGVDVDVAVAALQSLPGIGEWTAQYVAMRALGWPDAFPATDLGVLKALGVRSRAAALQAASRWRPWRGYAVMHLWRRGAPAR